MRTLISQKLFPTVLFILLIFSYNFQHFLNFLLPVSLKWLSVLFLIYAMAIMGLVYIKKMRVHGFDWFYGLTLVFLFYATAMAATRPAAHNVAVFLYIVLPFAAYNLVRILNFEKHFEFFFQINMVFLSIVVFFGIYEYFFAQDMLRVICLQFGRAANEEWPVMRYYRSSSFVMNFVHFSYYGLLLYFIFLVRLIYKKGIISFILLILSFVGMVTSLGMSSIVLALAFSFLFLLIHKEIVGKLYAMILVGIFIVGIAVAWTYFRDEIPFFERITHMLDSNESGHDFVFLGDLFDELKFLGTGSFQMVFEQEYFDALQRFGFIIGSVYLLLTFGIYYRAIRLLRFKEMRAYTVPLVLYCLSYVIIGFVHHTLDNSNQTILVFSFIAMLENRYRIRSGIKVVSANQDRSKPALVSPAACISI